MHTISKLFCAYVFFMVVSFISIIVSTESAWLTGGNATYGSQIIPCSLYAKSLRCDDARGDKEDFCDGEANVYCDAMLAGAKFQILFYVSLAVCFIAVLISAYQAFNWKYHICLRVIIFTILFAMLSLLIVGGVIEYFACKPLIEPYEYTSGALSAIVSISSTALAIVTYVIFATLAKRYQKDVKEGKITPVQMSTPSSSEPKPKTEEEKEAERKAEEMMEARRIEEEKKEAKRKEKEERRRNSEKYMKCNTSYCGRIYSKREVYKFNGSYHCPHCDGLLYEYDGNPYDDNDCVIM